MADISKPIIIVDSNEKINVTAEKNIGEYHFSIQNYNENEINEALLHYKIEIIANVDETITFELYKNNEQIKIDKNVTDYIDIGKNKKEFTELLDKAIKMKKGKDKKYFALLKKEALENTWEAKAKLIIDGMNKMENKIDGKK